MQSLFLYVLALGLIERLMIDKESFLWYSGTPAEEHLIQSGVSRKNQ